MFDDLVLIGSAFAFSVGGSLLGWLVSARVQRSKLQITQTTAQQIITNAQQESEDLKKTALLEARDEWRSQRGPLEKEQETQKSALRNLENNLLEREQQLDRKVDVLESKERNQLNNRRRITRLDRSA